MALFMFNSYQGSCSAFCVTIKVTSPALGPPTRSHDRGLIHHGPGETPCHSVFLFYPPPFTLSKFFERVEPSDFISVYIINDESAYSKCVLLYPAILNRYYTCLALVIKLV